MDNTPEFPHVATSPGEMSPEAVDSGHELPTKGPHTCMSSEQPRSSVGEESSDERLHSAPTQGTEMKETGSASKDQEQLTEEGNQKAQEQEGPETVDAQMDSAVETNEDARSPKKGESVPSVQVQPEIVHEDKEDNSGQEAVKTDVETRVGSIEDASERTEMTMKDESGGNIEDEIDQSEKQDKEQMDTADTDQSATMGDGIEKDKDDDCMPSQGSEQEIKLPDDEAKIEATTESNPQDIIDEEKTLKEMPADDETKTECNVEAVDDETKVECNVEAAEEGGEGGCMDAEKSNEACDSVTSLKEGAGDQESERAKESLDTPKGDIGSANIVDELISKGFVSQTSGDEAKKDPIPTEEVAVAAQEETPGADVDDAKTADSTARDDSERVAEESAAEEPTELMDTQILESEEEGNTQDSLADQSLGEERDRGKEAITKDGKLQRNMPPMKIFDECSMESFVSAKSSDMDYTDSLQGSPLPVKRVRELIDESPRSSPVPSKRSRASSPGSRDTDAAARSDDDLGHFPAENVFEYQWPQDGTGDYYFVQEQISEFLGVKSFKRKYPDLDRRVMDIKEKDFLRERGVVTEEQVTLGLMALKGEEVYDLMMKDYPNRYQEYAAVIQEKQRQNISNRHKGYEAPAVDASKIKEYIKKAAKQAAEFNAALMREKREDRQYYFDLQTMQLHMPQSKMKKLTKESTKIGAYPVAVIPGQYQDFCRDYTPDELRYLPLNTAIYGPMAIRRTTDYGQELDDPEGEDDLDSLSELNLLDELLSCNDKAPVVPTEINLPQQPQQHQQQQQPPPQQQQLHQQQQLQPLPPPPPPPSASVPNITPAPQGPPASAGPVGPIMVLPGPASSGDDSDIVRVPGPEALQLSMEAVVPINQPYQPKNLPDAICGLCLKDRHGNTKGVPEELVHCSQCDNSGHPSCLEMNDELVATIKTYPWQCMECKTCSQCGDPTHEDKMMFCDQCDRGYHTFCVGLNDIPTGLWLCPSCSSGGGIPPPTPPQAATPNGHSSIQLPPAVVPLPQQPLQPLQIPQQLPTPPPPQQQPLPLPLLQPAPATPEPTLGAKRKSSKR